MCRRNGNGRKEDVFKHSRVLPNPKDLAHLRLACTYRFEQELPRQQKKRNSKAPLDDREGWNHITCV